MRPFTGYQHGINLGGWLSQCDHTMERYETFITEPDIARIQSWGLDHIRVPVDYDLVEDAEGNYKEEGFGYIQRAIDWAGKYGLNMILDLHKTFGYSFDTGENESGFFDNEKYQERFYRLWEQFAARFGKYNDRLCFELLNEITDPAYCERWNNISTTCIKRIRALAPDTKILIGGYNYNSIMALKDLALPYDDKIVYNFHCYEPTVFTHQGAHWVAGMDLDFRMHFASTYAAYEKAIAEQIEIYASSMSQYDPDEVMSAKFFKDLMAEAARVAEERDVPLYCGEYGVIDLAEPGDALEWYRAICTAFDSYGIGRAAWSYKEMDFGFIDEHFQPVLEEVLKIM